ncbi:MAG: arabinosyltransferase, partial [Pseudonocardiaceae bacterium]
MLTPGHTETSRRPSGIGDEATERPPGRHRGNDRVCPRWRIAAAALGLLGALLAVLIPLLPVVQATTVITWPRPGQVAPVNAPLVTFQPQSLTATIPCTAATSADARTVQPASLLATTPPGSTDGAAVGMVLQVADRKLSLISRGQALGTPIPVPPGECLIKIDSD